MTIFQTQNQTLNPQQVVLAAQQPSITLSEQRHGRKRHGLEWDEAEAGSLQGRQPRLGSPHLPKALVWALTQALVLRGRVPFPKAAEAPERKAVAPTLTVRKQPSCRTGWESRTPRLRPQLFSHPRPPPHRLPGGLAPPGPAG